MSQPLVFVDVETTGLDPRTAVVHEIGCVVAWPEGGRNARVWRVRVPLRALLYYKAFKSAQAVHRIPTRTLLFEGISQAEAADEFNSFVLGQVGAKPKLAGHNVHFDAGFLKAMFARAKLKWPFGHRYRDLSTLGGEVLGVDDLKGICAALDVHLDHHTALGDTWATCNAYMALRPTFRALPGACPAEAGCGGGA